MIDAAGRILCETCDKRKTWQPVAEVQDGVLIIRAKHHGIPHVQTVAVIDLLPEPGTPEYSELVAELLRRIA